MRAPSWFLAGTVFGGGLAVGCVALLASLNGRFSCEPVLSALRNGTLKQNDPVIQLLGFGKPTVDLLKKGKDGREFGVAVFNHDHRIVVLLAENGRLFAAWAYRGVGPNEDEWFFCDSEKLAAYGQCSP